MQKLIFLLTFWLALTAIGASAQGNATVSVERMPDQVLMSDGSTVKGNVADGEYTLSAKGQAAYNWLGQDGQQVAPGATEQTPDMEAIVSADGVGRYLGGITATCQLARAFAKDFSVTDTSIAWGGNADDASTQSTGIANDGATDDNR